MADTLFISIGTIYQHLAHIRKKLNARNTNEILYILQKNPEPTMPVLRFSPQDKQVFILTLQGLTDKEISERLGIGFHGVRRHKERMPWKNGCETMRELICKYYGMGGERPTGRQPQKPLA